MKTEKSTCPSFEIQQTIESAYFKHKMLALEKRIEFYVLGDLVSHLEVRGQSEKLFDLLNLVFGDTILYTGATEISLTVRQLLQTENDVLLEFCLEDNGPNLRANSRSFKYYRTLASAKQIISELNGKSEVMSVPGVKTTLKFVICYELNKEDENSSITYDCAKLQGKKVLLAEDNEINQKAVATILRKTGINFDIVNNGKEAIELFERNRSTYNFILMDLHMPFMDGMQAANYIRKKLKSAIPIVALVAGEIGMDSADNHEVGINRYLSKPFKPQELIKCLNDLLAEEPDVHPFYHSKIA